MLRNGVATVIAAAVIGGGGTAAADTGGTFDQSDETGTVHHAVWRTRVTPKVERIRENWRTAGPTVRSKAYAFHMVAKSTWSGQQFQCLDSLWTRESNWNHRAYNPGSGAYGIPQALPGAKMSGVAADWRINPQTQIRWGLNYIRGRYGSPCGAWGHFQSHNWY